MKPLLGFGGIVLACALLVLAAILATASPAAPRACTHGASSAGPVVLVNGKLVANPPPHTEVCLP